MKAEKVSAQLSKNANDAQDMATKQGIDKAAAKYGAQIVQSNPIARSDALPGVGPAPEVMTSIFGSTEKSGPQVARYPQGYVVFEVTKVDPARTPSLEEIKDKVTTDFKNERARNSSVAKHRNLPTARTLSMIWPRQPGKLAPR